MAAGGFRFDKRNARQHPRRLTEWLISFEPKLNQLPAGNRLAENQPQFGIGLALGFTDKVVAQPIRGQTRNGEALRHSHQQFPEGCFANFEFHFRVDAQLGFGHAVV